ncbi:MAG: ice-binding family protein [Candidatus Cloacimonadaceae bacterium]|nr:ice-binding family protein [Candidatus Cloacimonadaceae bacterium]
MKNAISLVAMVFLLTTLSFAISTPVNVDITHDGTNVLINWDAVSGATEYRVYVCDDPYGVYILDETGTFPTPTSWTKTEPADKNFYIVKAERSIEPVDLGNAADYVILAKTGISSVPNSVVTGDVGISPAVASYITGFSLLIHPSGTYSTSTQVVGKVYAADYLQPTPTNLAAAIGDLEAAYTDAAGRTLPDYLNLGSGDISGLTLVPGLYKWGTGVLISSSVTLSGDSDDVWIFQIGEGITMDTAASIILSGGAKPENIFWQAAGVVALGTSAHLEGIVLGATGITLGTGSTVNGRLLAQTAVTLDQSTVTEPTP